MHRVDTVPDEAVAVTPPEDHPMDVRLEVTFYGSGELGLVLVNRADPIERQRLQIPRIELNGGFGELLNITVERSY